MVTVFWDASGILRVDFLEKGRSINSERSRVAVATAIDCGFELLPHPLYSPDLATSDFHLFPHMKKFCALVVGSDEETKNAVIDVLKGFPADFLETDCLLLPSNVRNAYLLIEIMLRNDFVKIVSFHKTVSE